MKFVRYIFPAVVMLFNALNAQSINRQALVQRHKVVNTEYNALSSLSVGNGRFAFTADITGMQSFPEAYAKGVALGTQSEWGWHSYIDTAGYRMSETLKYYELNGRKVPYSVQLKEPERSKDAVNWFRQNPHRLQLGNIGLLMMLKNGNAAGITDIKELHQVLDPWTGEIHVEFTVEGVPVKVITYCHQQMDLLSFTITSPLIAANRLFIRVHFPFPTADFKDVGVNWENNAKHSSVYSNHAYGATIKRTIDTTKYFVDLNWEGKASLQEKGEHDFLITPAKSGSFAFTCFFSESNKKKLLPSSIDIAANSKREWQKFWQSGGAVDFSGSLDARAFELERRIVLSQYLTKIQCAGNYPPQETGLTYNSWYGKPHLEMHWWHAVHFALWGRIGLMEKSLAWYAKVYKEAKIIAARQGYDGIRWQKMTDNQGKEGPSSVGAFLIWQQPHFIYFSELAWREHKDMAILKKYSSLVFATADFMASYAYYDSVKHTYILGKGVIPAQERFKAEDTYNPTYELVYWQWALEVAQLWRERLHLPRNKKWDDVLNKLSPLPVQDTKYLFTESATDSYTNPEYRKDHPAVFGALGMLPKNNKMDTVIMNNTFNWIMDNWSWKDTWGWDYPMTAMTATRLGRPEDAINSLLMPVQKNTYLVNGHNYQDDRLTIYLPGNGGLLTAIAMMCAGYDQSKIKQPGIPHNDQWKVRWEGLHKMP